MPSSPPLRLVTPDEAVAVVHATPADLRPHSATRIVARRRDSLVFLAPSEIWAFQAMVSRGATFVHCGHGKFQVDGSLAEIEASSARPLLRVHDEWLVDITHVRAFDRAGGEVTLFVGEGLGEERRGVRAPVSRGRVQQVREALLANATGLRPAGRGPPRDE